MSIEPLTIYRIVAAIWLITTLYLLIKGVKTGNPDFTDWFGFSFFLAAALTVFTLTGVFIVMGRIEWATGL